MPPKRVDPNGLPTHRTLKEIADVVGGEVIGDPATSIRGACGVKEARDGDITFLAGPKHVSLLEQTQASAVIVGTDVDWKKKPVIRAANPAVAFLKTLELWRTHEPLWGRGVDARAAVAASARLGKDVTVGPGAVIEDDCVIGDRTAVLAGAFVGRGTQTGSECVLYPHVVIRERCQIGSRVIVHAGAVIGADGFGYEIVDRKHVKVPQLGTVRIEDDVEIGANSCIDRARFGTTLIRRGTKIDNLVQIAHNVSIGEDCLIVSQVGIAGSAKLGDRVILAGQVGVVGHIEVGEGSMIGAQSGVFTSVPPNSILLGSPPRPVREEKELIIYVSRLPELFKDVRELKKKLEEKPVKS